MASLGCELWIERVSERDGERGLGFRGRGAGVVTGATGWPTRAHRRRRRQGMNATIPPEQEVGDNGGGGLGLTLCYFGPVAP